MTRDLRPLFLAFLLLGLFSGAPRAEFITNGSFDDDMNAFNGWFGEVNGLAALFGKVPTGMLLDPLPGPAGANFTNAGDHGGIVTTPLAVNDPVFDIGLFQVVELETVSPGTQLTLSLDLIGTNAPVGDLGIALNFGCNDNGCPFEIPVLIDPVPTTRTTYEVDVSAAAGTRALLSVGLLDFDELGYSLAIDDVSLVTTVAAPASLTLVAGLVLAGRRRSRRQAA